MIFFCTGIKGLKPDVIVGDSHFSCSGVLNDLLDSKLVLICPSGLTHGMLPIFKNPNPLSYAPQPFSGLDDQMDFKGRMINVAGWLLTNFVGRVFMFPAVDKIKKGVQYQARSKHRRSTRKGGAYACANALRLGFSKATDSMYVAFKMRYQFQFILIFSIGTVKQGASNKVQL